MNVRGIQVAVPGTSNTRARTMTSQAMNAQQYLTVWSYVVPAMLVATNSSTATGGVVAPICVTIVIRIPTCIGSNPNRVAMVEMTGTRMIITASDSRSIPSTSISASSVMKTTMPLPETEPTSR